MHQFLATESDSKYISSIRSGDVSILLINSNILVILFLNHNLIKCDCLFVKIFWSKVMQMLFKIFNAEKHYYGPNDVPNEMISLIEFFQQVLLVFKAK